MAAKRKKKKSSTARRAKSMPAKSTGTISAVRVRVTRSVRDYVRAVENLLDWLEVEVDRATSAARDQLDRLLKEAGRQIQSLEATSKQARKRLTAPYRSQAAKLLARLEDGIADVAPELLSSAKMTKKKSTRKKKRSTEKRKSKATRRA
jgi:hypothetical protein